MASNEWPTIPIERLVDDILDRRGVTPLKLGSAFTESGHRVISAKSIKRNRVDLSADDARFVSDSTYDKWMRTKLAAGDVLLTSEAPLGELAYLPTEVDWCLGQRLFAIRAKQSVLDGRFLYYAMQSPAVQNDLHSRASGTTVLGIRQSELRHVRIPVPPISEQQAIATVLGALDDKIELNRKMSGTLEATARALFKSWFVDFNPVREKRKGRGNALSDELLELFPAAFHNSDLGAIPVGWTIHEVGEVATIDKGLSYKGEFLSDGGLPMVNLACFTGEGKFDASRIKMYAGEYKERHLVHNGDLVMANTDITQKRLVLGSPGLVSLATTGPGLFTHHTFAVRLSANFEYLRGYLYHAFLDDRFRERAMGFATGTTVLALPKDAVLNYKFVLPPRPVVAAFNDLTRPMRSRQELCMRESHTERVLRDALLPKLISGELRVRDAERILEKSA